MQSVTRTTLRAAPYRERHEILKELKETSSPFRLRSRLVELARMGFYGLLMYFGFELMNPHLNLLWMVVVTTLGFFLIDWILYRCLTLPAAELEIRKKAGHGEG